MSEEGMAQRKWGEMARHEPLRCCACGYYAVNLRFCPVGTDGVLPCPLCHTSPYTKPVEANA